MSLAWPTVGPVAQPWEGLWQKPGRQPWGVAKNKWEDCLEGALGHAIGRCGFRSDFL